MTKVKKVSIERSIAWSVVFSIVAILGCKDENAEAAGHKSTRSGIVSVGTKSASPTSVDLAAWRKTRVPWRKFAGVKLSILGESQGAFQSLVPLLPQFEALTGIKVNMLLLPEEEMRRRLRIDLSSKSGIFDVVPEGITDLGEAEHGHWLEPLEPYLADSVLTDKDWLDMDDFSPQVLSLCRSNGRLLTLPFDFSAPVFFYRKDLFEKYGIQVPDTYEGIVAMKRRLQDALEADGRTGIDAFATRTTVGAGDNTWTIIPAIRAYGGDMFDSRWRPIFQSPDAVRALTVYRDMVTGRGSPAESRTQTFMEQRRLFREGKLASGIFASHIFAFLNDSGKSAIVGKWDAALPPRGPSGRFTSPWAWAFGINSSSRQKSAAWLFVEWAVSKETAALLGEGVGPARRSVWTPEYEARQGAAGLAKAYQWIMDSAANSAFQMGVPEFPEAGLIASKSFSEIFYGADPEVALRDAAIRVERVMLAGPTRKLADSRAGR